MVEIPQVRSIEETAWRSECTIPIHTRKELQELRQVCAGAMTSLDQEKDALAAHMTLLQKQREELEDRIEKLDSTTALWKVLPQELWSRIFEFTQNNERVHLSKSPPDCDDIRVMKDTFPERVCSLWRQIVLRTPSLYATIKVDYANLGGKADCDELTEHAAEMIARGTRRLYLDFQYVDANSSMAYFQSLVGTAASRLEWLEVSQCGVGAHMDLLAAVASSIPTLPLLQHFKDNIENHPTDALWFPMSSVTNGVHWSQMRILSIGGNDSNVNIRPPMFLFLLCSCPQLTECEFGLRRAREDILSPLPLITGGHVTHSKLKSLTLRFKSVWAEDTSAVFDSFIFPALEKMSLRIDFGTIRPTDILSLINRSRCNLLSFQFCDHTLSAAGLSRLFDGLPSVMKISINATIMTPNLLDRIARAELLPKLVELEGFLIGDLQSIEALRNVAESRWEGKNGTDIQIIDVEYEKVPDWTPPEFSSEWKEMFQADRRWLVRPAWGT